MGTLKKWNPHFFIVCLAFFCLTACQCDRQSLRLKLTQDLSIVCVCLFELWLRTPLWIYTCYMMYINMDHIGMHVPHGVICDDIESVFHRFIRCERNCFCRFLDWVI